jgi:uncharacterized protein with ATP-grasp and redox domains
MRTSLKRKPCFVRQALDASRRVTDDQAVHERVVRGTQRLAAETPIDRITLVVRDVPVINGATREDENSSHDPVRGSCPQKRS